MLEFMQLDQVSPFLWVLTVLLFGIPTAIATTATVRYYRRLDTLARQARELDRGDRRSDGRYDPLIADLEDHLAETDNPSALIDTLYREKLHSDRREYLIRMLPQAMHWVGVLGLVAGMAGNLYQLSRPERAIALLPGLGFAFLVGIAALAGALVTTSARLAFNIGKVKENSRIALREYLENQRTLA